MSLDAVLVSVIVPVYNAEAYLLQCVESILGQTYQQLEVILVNDGSTDGSGEICDQMAARDARVRVIHQDNAGVASARNSGLKAMQGVFFTVVDSDDWIDFDTVESAIGAAVECDADVVIWPYVREYRGASLPKRIFDFEQRAFSGEEVRDLCQRIAGPLDGQLRHPHLADTLGTAACKLYRRRIVGDPAVQYVDLEKIGSGEDLLFNLQVLTYAKTVVYLNRCMYHYRRDNVSSITTRHRPNLPTQWKRLYKYMSEHIRQANLGREFERALENRVALSLFGLGMNIMASDESRRQQCSDFERLLADEEYGAAFRRVPLSQLAPVWRPLFAAASHQWHNLVWAQFWVLVTLRQLRVSLSRGPAA